MSAALLEARALTLRAGHRELANGLSLEVRRKELWCVLGPNGCGKTTLLLTLAGLRQPESGEVRLCERAFSQWKLADAARVRGYLPQAVHDSFSASVLDAVVIGRHPHLPRWHWEDEDDGRIAREALARVGLEDFAHRDVLTLSGGERQRAAIAAVLAQDPALMLLDEPVSHLDLRHQAQMMLHLQHLAREGDKGIVLSLHDVNLAARYATHALVFLPQARLVQGRAQDVLTEAILSEAYEHPLQSFVVEGRPVFVPRAAESG